MRLAHRRAVITGASRGLGAEIAKAFVAEGASVALAARSRGALEEVAAALRPNSADGRVCVAIQCDISVASEVDALAARAADAMGGIDVLVNNASIFGPMGRLDEVSWSDWIETLNVNLLGTVYACRAMGTHLKASARGKIVNVTGGGAARPLPSLCAYATSKAGIMRFTEELAEELRPFGVDVNSMAPGPLNTRFVDEAIAAGPARLGRALYDEIIGIRTSGGTPFELGAALCAFLSSRDSDGLTGKTLSARYDDWEGFAGRAEELESSEIYTMRRIDPSTLRRLKHLL